MLENLEMISRLAFQPISPTPSLYGVVRKVVTGDISPQGWCKLFDLPD